MTWLQTVTESAALFDQSHFLVVILQTLSIYFLFPITFFTNNKPPICLPVVVYGRLKLLIPGPKRKGQVNMFCLLWQKTEYHIQTGSAQLQIHNKDQKATCTDTLLD